MARTYRVGMLLKTTYLQLCFSVFIAKRIIGPSPVGVRVAKPLPVLSAVFSGLF